MAAACAEKRNPVHDNPTASHSKRQPPLCDPNFSTTATNTKDNKAPGRRRRATTPPPSASTAYFRVRNGYHAWVMDTRAHAYRLVVSAASRLALGATPHLQTTCKGSPQR